MFQKSDLELIKNCAKRRYSPPEKKNMNAGLAVKYKELSRRMKVFVENIFKETDFKIVRGVQWQNQGHFKEMLYARFIRKDAARSDLVIYVHLWPDDLRIGVGFHFNDHNYIEENDHRFRAEILFKQYTKLKCHGFSMEKDQDWWYFKNDSDIEEISEANSSQLIKKLIPLYDEGYKLIENADRKKITRIFWNNNGWENPSGPQGKSNNKSTFEFKSGFGHEEWLFDFSKVIDGYKYGFIEGIHRGKHIGKEYDLGLFSICSENKKYYLIGKITIECISKEESKKIYEIYKNNGWISDMESELHSIGLTPYKGNPEEHINVRFKIDSEQYTIFEEPKLFEPPKNMSRRYIIQKFPNKLEFPQNTEEFQMNENPPSGNQGDSSRKQKQKMTTVSQKHKKIQKEIYEYLKRKNPKSRVGSECETGFARQVDIVVEKNNKKTFYEIKVGKNALYCIREALGQLLEYSYFPNKENADKLVIVSTLELNEKEKTYIKHLRETINMPIHYQKYNEKENILEICD